MPTSVIAFVVSSFSTTGNEVATGGSLTGAIWIVTVAGAELSVASEATNVKLSEPLKFAAGV